MTMSFDYMLKDIKLATVFIDDKDKVTVENYTNDIVDRPFGTNENPTIADVKELFKERVFPETRYNAKQILKGKLYGYDPFRIVLDTHGILVDDYYWIRFDHEKDLTWNDVKHWKFPDGE